MIKVEDIIVGTKTEIVNDNVGTITFVPFYADHAFKMNWKDKDEFMGMYKSSPQYFHIMEAKNEAITVIKGNLILGILMIRPINNDHAEVSIYMSHDYINEFDKELYKITKEVIADLTAEYARVSAEVKTDNKKLEKLMIHLGFELEGVMRKYGHHGEDYSLYSIISEE